MKVQRFLTTVEKFQRRAVCFFPTDEFKAEVKRLCTNVRSALYKQLGMESCNDANLPGGVDMGEEALKAFEELCSYLDKEDSGQFYGELAGLGQQSVVP